MSRIPSVYNWKRIHPQKVIAFAKVHDARNFEDDPYWSGTSICEVVVNSPSDISFAPDGSLHITDIAGGWHYLPAGIVGETHIRTAPIGQVLDLDRILNPDQPLEEQVVDLYRRTHGRVFHCSACGEPIPREEWDRANIEVELNRDRTYARDIRAVHARPECSGSFARTPSMRWYRISQVAE
jgi:hypothetical protein